MCFSGRPKVIFDTDVQLFFAHLEPATASRAQRAGLFDFREPQNLTEEAARFGFAAARRRKLHMVDVDQEHAKMFRAQPARMLRSG